MNAVSITQIREAQRRTERAEAEKANRMLQERVIYQQRRIQRLEAALQRMAG